MHVKLGQQSFWHSSYAPRQVGVVVVDPAERTQTFAEH